MSAILESETRQTTRNIRKAVVIGAGIMGAGIAAHLANAGVSVHLLDIVPKDADDRSIIAKSALQRMLKATPATDPLNAGFMDPANAKRVTPGNTEDDLEAAVSDADWIVEVVIEDLAIKQALFSRLDTLRKPGSIVSSNTSTIPLNDLVSGRSEDFRRHFVITHFFNPPRFMHLLEVVGGDDTDSGVLESIRTFGDLQLGKNVILCKDTPAFIANRIGIYFMFRTIVETVQRQMRLEEVDAVLGRPMGYPKEGIFGLLDLVGIGIMPHITDSLLKTLPQNDPFRSLNHEPGLTLVNTLIADGRTGRKSPKGGFYRMHKREDGSKQKQVLDIKTGDYYDVGKPRLKGVQAARKHGPRAVFETDDEIGRFAWVVMRDTLLYAAHLIPEIADDIADVDASLRDGYNAKWGPFELLDKLGVAWFTRKLILEGIELPPVLKLANNRPFYREYAGRIQRLIFDFANNQATYADLPSQEGVLQLSDIKRRSRPLIAHYSAQLWDIGDGVACLEFTSKMNTLDPSILWVLNRSLQFIQDNPTRFKALVIYNEEKNFSLGANLGLLQAGFQAARLPTVKALGLSRPLENWVYRLVEAMVYHGQSVFKAMREAPFPVVGAPQGMALGGGCEILLHCNALQASAETYMGLVESGVGVIPGWGGCVRYLERAMAAETTRPGPVPPVRAAFQALMMPQFSVSTSALDARRKLWLGPDDGITMNKDRLLAEAKAKALAMAQDYTPPGSAAFRLPGVASKSTLRMALDDFYIKGDATWHDVVVGDALTDVLTGGDTHPGKVLTDSDIAQLEREHFLSLLRMPQTQKRIANTLKTGKPLREGPLQEDKSLDAIRGERKPVKLANRPLSGKPLKGCEGFKLRLMADMTALLLKLSGN